MRPKGIRRQRIAGHERELGPWRRRGALFDVDQTVRSISLWEYVKFVRVRFTDWAFATSFLGVRECSTLLQIYVGQSNI